METAADKVEKPSTRVPPLPLEAVHCPMLCCLLEPLWTLPRWIGSSRKRRISFSSCPSSVSPEEVRDLWVACFGNDLDPRKRDTGLVEKALRNSFTMQAAFLEAQDVGGPRMLIGFARHG